MDGLEYLETPYKLCRVDNCGIRFKVKSNGFSTLSLVSKQCPHKEICKINLGLISELIFPGLNPIVQETSDINIEEYTEFWLTWFNGIYRIGEIDQAPFLEYTDNSVKRPVVGFIQFFTLCQNTISDWIFESPPKTLSPMKSRKIDGGQLSWSATTGNVLPLNAMIGGFENEPIYVSRAHHMGSLCPGKYVPSKGSTFVAWGHSEHAKDDFEILCGYDAQWVNCTADDIPLNAFVAGMSEVNNEPLYIGRAMVDNKLICGKVHLLYKACFIPSNGREVERYRFEILVSPVVSPEESRAVQIPKCYCNI